MNKAIVTGASGFIGRWLVRELLNYEIEVIAVIRQKSKNRNVLENYPVRIIECDMNNFQTLPDLISDRDIDVLFHTAWQGVSDSDAKNESVQIENLLATLILIDKMNDMGIGTFVGAGSMHEVEAVIESKNDKVITNLGFMYKASKTAAHWMAKAKAGNYGIRFFWPLINTYGEQEKSNRLINTMIRQILKGESPALSIGTQYYDFVHVMDVAHALYLIAERGVDGSNYTIGSGNAMPLKDYLQIVGTITNELKGGAPIELGFGKIKNNVVPLPREIFDISKLQKDTGFFPQISFEEGVKRTAIWIANEMLDS